MLIVAVTLLSLANGAAGIETSLLAGKRLLLRQGKKGDRLVLVSRDNLTAPLPGGADDPTLLGAVLEIGNPQTGEWARLPLPIAGWSINALGTVFRYHDKRPRGQGLTVRALVIQHEKRLKLSGPVIGLTLDESAQRSIAAIVTTGSRRYCLLFAGTAVRQDEPRRFAARDAPAPAACPEPAFLPATTTTTSTSSTRTSTTRPQGVPSTTSTSSSTTTSPSTSTPTTSSSTRTTTSTSTTRSTTSTSTSTTRTTTSTSTSSSRTTTTTSTSSTTLHTQPPCGGIKPFCGGACPAPQFCGSTLSGCGCRFF